MAFYENQVIRVLSSSYTSSMVSHLISLLCPDFLDRMRRIYEVLSISLHVFVVNFFFFFVYDPHYCLASSSQHHGHKIGANWQR